MLSWTANDSDLVSTRLKVSGINHSAQETACNCLLSNSRLVIVIVTDSFRVQCKYGYQQKVLALENELIEF